jgi:hypothetical protein
MSTLQPFTAKSIRPRISALIGGSDDEPDPTAPSGDNNARAAGAAASAGVAASVASGGGRGRSVVVGGISGVPVTAFGDVLFNNGAPLAQDALVEWIHNAVPGQPCIVSYLDGGNVVNWSGTVAGKVWEDETQRVLGTINYYVSGSPGLAEHMASQNTPLPETAVCVSFRFPYKDTTYVRVQTVPVIHGDTSGGLEGTIPEFDFHEKLLTDLTERLQNVQAQLRERTRELTTLRATMSPVQRAAANRAPGTAAVTGGTTSIARVSATAAAARALQSGGLGGLGGGGGGGGAPAAASGGDSTSGEEDIIVVTRAPFALHDITTWPALATNQLGGLTLRNTINTQYGRHATSSWDNEWLQATHEFIEVVRTSQLTIPLLRLGNRLMTNLRLIGVNNTTHRVDQIRAQTTAVLDPEDTVGIIINSNRRPAPAHQSGAKPGGKRVGIRPGGIQCTYCGKFGHVAAKCYSNPANPNAGGGSGATRKQ